MKSPPIEWDDLYALGLQPGSTITSSATGHAVNPQPPRLVRQLLAELVARPAPDDDRVAYLRHVRDLLVSLTDYTQANDSPFSSEKRAAWATYRQALRDLPSVYSGDGPIPWPVPPS